MKAKELITGLILLTIFSSCKKDEQPEKDILLFSASGNISTKMDEFRALLGRLNTTTGNTVGRREINWDSVPDSLTDKPLPNNFFNPTGANAPVARQRGLVYQVESEIMVSKMNFAAVNPVAASQFIPFSGNKSFAVANSNLWPIEFRVAGQTNIAAVKGLGIVFNDVDKSNSTAIEFFNEASSLGKFFVPAHNDNSNFSFLGVYFKNKMVTKIMVSHEGILMEGEKDISQGGSKDLVTLDDFIYSEPIAN